MKYLDHIILRESIATNSDKVVTIKRWPILTTLKKLRGLLGLTKYYKKFIKGYRAISKPLIELLKKDNTTKSLLKDI